MRHGVHCLGILAFAALCIHTIGLNVEARQRGYRVAENLQQADNLRQIIATRRAACRRLVEMDDVQKYVAELGLTIDALLPPVIPEERYDALVQTVSTRSAARGRN